MEINEIKQVMLSNEKNLCENATFDKDAVRLKVYDSDIRPNYFRDIDRIIHSLSYTRYIDKTQVFSLNDDDNISKRIIHVQLVSKIAKTIGRALSLNEDLIEAIALGHDIGHVPFGHAGEAILNKISLENGEGYFMHNVQSVRTFMELENEGNGSNLTVQVLDGILCHNGEFVLNEYKPKKKEASDFLADYYTCYENNKYASTLVPMTLEGCVVRVSDVIAYLGRDIEDAIRLGILRKEDIPNDIVRILGRTNREIVNNIILDIIGQSFGKNYIKMSDDVFKAVVNLKKFNYENIYNKANTKEQLLEYEKMIRTVFEYNRLVIKNHDRDEDIYTTFLDGMKQSYIQNTSANRIAIDYIAGMTDDYLIKQYKNIVAQKEEIRTSTI